jgi:hypothetical protein
MSFSANSTNAVALHILGTNPNIDHNSFIDFGTNALAGTYKLILQDLVLDLPLHVRAYEPMRVVDGATDNLYSPESFPIELEWTTP